MDISSRFLTQLRQYAILESKMNRDFTPMVSSLAVHEAERLMSEGMSETDAYALVNQTLTNEVKRFPVQIDVIPF